MNTFTKYWWINEIVCKTRWSAENLNTSISRRLCTTNPHQLSYRHVGISSMTKTLVQVMFDSMNNLRYSMIVCHSPSNQTWWTILMYRMVVHSRSAYRCVPLCQFKEKLNNYLFTRIDYDNKWINMNYLRTAPWNFEAMKFFTLTISVTAWHWSDAAFGDGLLLK